MPFIYDEPSHTFGEYLLIPNYTSEDCTPQNTSLVTPLVKYRRGEAPELSLNIPLVSAIMQSVSNDTLAVALAKEGGVSFIYGSQSVESQAAMVRRVKKYKAGFVESDSCVTPDSTVADLVALKEQKGHSTVAVTHDGSPTGKLLGVVTSRDYRISRISPDEKVKNFMTPIERLITAPEGTSLKEANDIIWDHKLNSLPIVDSEGNMVAFVFRKDYDFHKDNPLELLDSNKRYVVGAGINSRDYETRVPALVEAGADVLCIDSSEGYTAWQANTLKWIRDTYGDKVKCGAGNVVDREGFLFLANAGADFVKVGIGGGSICITRETKGIGRGQATAVMEVAKARDEYYVGRYFARFDESPTNKVMVNGSYMKEYWGEGSARARNWQRYDMGAGAKLSFEEGVDSYVPYAGSLHDNVTVTLAKVRSTMCNCGALTIPQLKKTARLTLVSPTSIVEGGAHDVVLKEQKSFGNKK